MSKKDNQGWGWGEVRRVQEQTDVKIDEQTDHVIHSLLQLSSLRGMLGAGLCLLKSYTRHT